MRQVGSPIDSSSVESLCVRRIASWNAWSGNLAKSALGKGLDLGLPGAEPHGGYMRFDAESVNGLVGLVVVDQEIEETSPNSLKLTVAAQRLS